MPVQVVPHMYRMLVDELQVAVTQVSVIRLQVRHTEADRLRK